MATFQITLRTNDDDNTAVRHLRQALKVLWRKHHLQCTHIEEGNKQTAQRVRCRRTRARLYVGGKIGNLKMSNKRKLSTIEKLERVGDQLETLRMVVDHIIETLKKGQEK